MTEVPFTGYRVTDLDHSGHPIGEIFMCAA